jgi:hypothetical protein
MAELYNCLDDKGFQAAFTQNAEDPNGMKLSPKQNQNREVTEL